ncbi:hypothetical protein VNO77_17531 [Canavalia gladiata]
MSSFSNNSSNLDNLLLQTLMGRLQLRAPINNPLVTQSLEDFLFDAVSDVDDDDDDEGKSELAKEEAKLEREVIKIILSGNSDSLKPNSGQAVSVRDHHICVGFQEEEGSDYRVWEWHGHVMVFDDEFGYTPEYIYGNYFQRLKPKPSPSPSPPPPPAAADASLVKEEKPDNLGLRELIDTKDSSDARILHRNINAGSPRARASTAFGCEKLGGRDPDILSLLLSFPFDASDFPCSFVLSCTTPISRSHITTHKFFSPSSSYGVTAATDASSLPSSITLHLFRLQKQSAEAWHELQYFANVGAAVFYAHSKKDAKLQIVSINIGDGATAGGIAVYKFSGISLFSVDFVDVKITWHFVKSLKAFEVKRGVLVSKQLALASLLLTVAVSCLSQHFLRQFATELNVLIDPRLTSLMLSTAVTDIRGRRSFCHPYLRLAPAVKWAKAQTPSLFPIYTYSLCFYSSPNSCSLQSRLSVEEEATSFLFINRPTASMAPTKGEKKPAEKKPAEKAPAEKKPKAEKKISKEGGSDKKKKRVKKSTETYKIYIFKVLKQVHPDIGISSKAMGIMNSFINDIFEKLAQESSRLARYNKKPTITSREIQTAVRLVLPGELAKHAVSEGTKAVTKFTSS